MANKQYISIIRLFNHCSISTGPAFNLPRARKQLIAEFSFAKEGFIETGGFSYTRHDVMEELEQPDFESRRLAYHQQLWEKPVLLSLLEQNKLADFRKLAVEFKSLFGNVEFDQFFSPYFAGPFNNVSRTLLNQSHFGAMEQLLLYEDFLQPAEREEAFRPLRLFMHENIRVMRNVNGENYSIMRPKMLPWIEGKWSGFFNALPFEFYDVKNDFIVLLINIGVAVQKSQKSDCKAISHQLMALTETPEHLRSVVVSNHAVYVQSKSSNYTSIFWVVIIVIKLLALGSC